MTLENKRYRLIIFDWDGTLMDSTGRIVSAMRSSAKLCQLTVPSEAEVKGIIGLSMQAVMNRLFAEISESERNEFLEVYRHQYIELDPTPSPLFDGALSLLSWLRSQSILIAVATGKARAGLSRVLHEVDLMDFFDHSICADEAESKPHPEMVLHLLKTSGHNAHETLVVGDSIHDLRMAANANVDAVGVSSGANLKHELESLKPLSVIPDVSHLKAWLESLILN